MSILKITESYTLDGCIIWYVNHILIKLLYIKLRGTDQSIQIARCTEWRVQGLLGYRSKTLRTHLKKEFKRQQSCPPLSLQLPTHTPRSYPGRCLSPWSSPSLCTCVCGRGALCFSCSVALCDPMDYSPPVHGILQARVLEWVAFPFSRGSSWCRDQTQVSCTVGIFFTIWATREALSTCLHLHHKLGVQATLWEPQQPPNHLPVSSPVLLGLLFLLQPE